LASPNRSNDFLADHAELLCDSFRRLTGRELIDPSGNPSGDRIEVAKQLYDAPFAVVSHDTSDDPIFNYANKKAMELFAMDWQTITQLPSRKSAEPVNREERARLLRTVAEHGFIDDYSGIRISSSGRRFRIDNATVWNLIDRDGNYAGQAAMFAHWAFV
jgi:hypothetical protein